LTDSSVGKFPRRALYRSVPSIAQVNWTDLSLPRKDRLSILVRPEFNERTEYREEDIVDADKHDLVLRDVDVTSAEDWDDPYPYLAQIRNQGPIVWCPDWDMWLTADYRTANALLRHPGSQRVFQDRSPQSDWASFNRLNSLSALDRSGSDHARLRKAMSPPFRKSTWMSIEAVVEAVVKELLDSMLLDPHTTRDLVPEFLEPLPVRVICSILNLSENNGKRLREASEQMVAAFEKCQTPNEAYLSQAGAREMEEILAAGLSRASSSTESIPLDFLMSQCPAHLSFEEAVASAALLFNGGTGAVINASSTGVVTILRDVTVRQALLSNDSIDLSTVVDEILRFDAPLQLFERLAVAPIMTATIRIPAGERIGLLLGGANHDPSVFVQPERFTMNRNPNPHLTFSAGTHFCLGASLARLEMKTALEHLLNRFPGISLSGEPVRHHGFVVRGYASIPVQLMG